MSRFKNRLVKRVMAVILSGAMVMSNMTAFASEAPSDTGGGYFSEMEDVGREDDADIETAEKEDAVDDKSTNVLSKEETTSKDEDNVSSDKKDDNKDAEDTAKETVAADEAGRDDEADAVEDDKTSETKSSLNAEVEEDESEEKDAKEEREKSEDLKYDPPTGTSTYWKDYAGIFKGSVFGTVNKGISNPSDYYALETNADGSMRVASLGNAQKVTNASDTIDGVKTEIPGGEDGFTMYYYQVPISKTFTLKAKATVTVSSDGQGAFGLMARDDMYIDTKVTGLLSNYVVAGTLGNGQINNFTRIDQWLDKSSTGLTPDVAAGVEYNISLSFDGSKYVCQIEGNETKEYEASALKLNTVDTEYQYIGMVASRASDITYSDIYLKVGDEVLLDQVNTAAEKYTITVNSDENGTAEANAAESIEGAMVTLTATPNEGYCFKEWQVQTGDGSVDVTIEKNQFIMPKGNVSIKAIFKEIPTEWSFRQDGGLMKGSGKELNQISNAVITLDGLVIDTTASGAKFHTDRDNGAQVNAGTVIKVPLKGKSKVTVEGYNQYSRYTVDGTQNTQQTQTFTCEGTDGYATIVMLTEAKDPNNSDAKTNGEYLYSIKVVAITGDEKPRTEWSFHTDSDLREGITESNNFQGIEGTFAGLEIDATHGKFNITSNNNWAQVNTGTIIKAPVNGASEVTVEGYSDKTKFTVDGMENETKTDTFICKGTDGWVTIKMTGTEDCYLGSIKVVKELDKVKVSGDVTLPADAPSNMKVIFTEKTDRASKFVIEADIVDGKYETELYCTGEKYAISLSDESYNVTVPEGAVINVAKNEQGISQPITAIKVDISSVTGDVKFPAGKTIPTDLKLTFTEKVESGTQHVVEDVEVTNGKYTAALQPNTTYTVTATGTRINDFDIKAPAEISTATNGNVDIEFVEKATYGVTLAVTSFDDDAIDKSKIALIFTNVNETDCTYGFKGTDTIALRTGTYSVSAKAGYPYMPIKIAAFQIESATKGCALDFEERLEWSFHSGSDLMAAENQMSVEGAGAGENGIVDLEGLKIDVTNGKFNTDGRGADAQVNKGTIIKIPLRTKSEVTIEGYDAGSNYKVDGKPNTKQTDTFVCEGTDGYATFEMLPATAGTNGEYLKGITVKPIKETVIPDNRKIDVWDFAGKLETDTTKYNNNITPAMWVESGLLQTSSDGDIGRFKGTKNDILTHEFGDLLMTYHGQDRLYSSVPELKAISAGTNNYITTYDDGYTTVGAWYCNGGGSATTRNVTIDNVAVGDKIILYAGRHKDSTTYYFEGQGVENTQKDAGPLLTENNSYQKHVFIAEHTGTYKIYPVGSGSDPKNLYHRVVRIPGAKVSGTIDFKTYALDNYTVKFINQETKQEFPVTVKEDKSFELSLAPGYTYLAVLSGAPGYGFANEGKTITIPEDSTAIDNVRLTVETKDMYQFTGKIKGMETGANTGILVITMIPPQDSNSDEVTLNVNKETLSFDAYLESNLEYTIQLEGADDYVVKTPLSVKSIEDLSQDIVLELKPRYTANGAFIGLDDAKVTDLSFTLLDKNGAEDTNYVYPATIANGGYGYSIQLRDGAYIAKATVDKEGYSTQSHVVVNGADVYKDLMFISAEDTTALERVANLYVGYPGKKNNYSTVTAAVKAAKRMNPANEEERITIHIAPGTYTEQLLITVPYITFTNDEPSKEVKLTWYYGIGYKYYSAKGGYYDEASAFDKYEKYEAKDWGTTVRLNARGFRAENITFENSLNQRIVEAELEDGVEPAGTKPERKVGVDVESKPYKERACVMYINDSGDEAEFYRCKFISNQDTLGSGKAGTHSYFKECLLEGTTDYICGGGDCVFDECELRWAGQSDSPEGGYITAPSGTNNKGYLFWNCTITAHPDRKVSAGYLGRPWGADAKATFVNTKLGRADLIQDVGWTEMGSNLSTVQNAGGFKEYNTTYNGTPVNTSKRLANTVATENPVTDMTTYFGSWTPLYYNYDETKVVREPVSSEKRSDVPTGTKITLSCDTADAKIYYTINGEDPTGNESELYAGEFSLGDEEKTVIVKAIAKVGDVSSNVAVFEYNVKSPTNLIAAPKASVESGVVKEGTVVLLSCATNGATIYFTTDGTEPKVDNDLLYRNQPILIYETKTIKAIAVKDINVSEPVSFEYKVKPTITAEPGDGTAFASTGGTVTLKATKGAKIYYTISATQGGLTDPANESNTKREEYTGTPIPIKEETYIWAVAVSGDLTSDALKCHYTVLEEGAVVKPTADPDGSKPVKSKTIVKLNVTDDTVEQIYYTTDGSDPITSDTRKTYNPVAGIVITEAVTIKAAAQKGDTYSEVATFTYTIENGDDPKDPSDSDDPGENFRDIQITGLKASYDYTGANIIPDIKVWDCDIKGGDRRLLTEGTDYTVKYANNKNETTADKPATVTVVGKGNYAGKDVTETFQIKASELVTNPINVKGYKIDKIADQEYTGNAQYPEFKLIPKDKAQSPVEYKYDTTKKQYVRTDEQPMDVNVAVSGNINKGTATILVTGEKDAKGKASSVKKTFKITPVDLKANASKVNVTVSPNPAPYAVKGAMPSVTVKYDGKTLKNGRDYTVKYAKNKTAEDAATVTVVGKGNYAKKCDPVGFSISKLNMSQLTIKAVTACSDMKAGKVKATIVDLDKNVLKASQYTLTIYKNETGPETYDKNETLEAKKTIYVEATAKDDKNLTGTTARVPFTVGIDISKAKIGLKKVNGKAATKSYEGVEIELKPEEMEGTIKVNGESKDLHMSADNGLTGDYIIVSYSNNINKGTATAVIQGINDYSGTKTIKFKITQKTMVKGTTPDPSVNPVSNLINNFITKFAN